MSTLIPSQFCRYNLSAAEEKRGQLLTIENLQVLQNDLADLAEEKIRLTLSKASYDEYWQREAELQGSIQLLQGIINRHHALMQDLESIEQMGGLPIES